VKSLIVSCARKLHDWSFVFPALVKSFRALQRIGINPTPNHFYWPVPDLAELERRDWPTYSPPPGCAFDLRKQVELAWELAEQYGDEWRFSSDPHEHCYHYSNGYFEAVDAEVAYCMVRHFKPAQIVEIGTGYSTRVLATALKINSQFEVLWASSAMHLEHPLVLEHCFPRWRNSYLEMPELKRRFVPTFDNEHVWPSSFWMRRL
jgi:hypothetical protein